MIKPPPFATDRTYFNRDARPWIENNRAWSKAQTDITLDVLWYDTAIRDLYRAHKNGAQANVLAGFVPGQVPIPLHPHLNADKAIAKQGRQRPSERDAVGGLLVADGAAGAGVGAGAAGPVAPPAAPPVTPITPDPAGGPPAGSLHPDVAVEPAVTLPTAPAAPANLYMYDFWPPQPWDADPDADQIPRTENIKSLDLNGPEDMKAISDFRHSKPLMQGVDETTWVGTKYLGTGSFGAAGVWCRVDDNQNIIERMVVKDYFLNNDAYSVPKFWYDQLPSEIAMHRRIDRKRKREDMPDVGFEHLVEHVGYRLMMRRRRYRLYLKYYPGGDLQDSVWNTLSKWLPPHLTNGLSDDAFLNQSADTLAAIPTVAEGLLWYILRSLVKAFLILRHGTTSDTVVDPEWKPITHLDLTYNNVFLEPGLKSNPPTKLVLSDLGLSFIERTAAPVAEGEEPLPSENPYEFLLRHKFRNHAPERHPLHGNPPVLIGEKTDVWKLGSMMWEIMTGSRDEDHVMREDCLGRDGSIRKNPVTSDDDKSKLTEDAIFPTPWRFYPSADRYSPELKQLIRDCLHYHPADRKSFKELDQDIERYIGANPMIMHNVTAFLKLREDEEAIGTRLKRQRY